MALIENNGGLRFITGYRFATDFLKAVNHMTFFYNPLWEYNESTKGTLPVVFFHLKNIHEVMESEVQTKKVMFYNSQKETTSDSASGSIINVIADNIVNKPKSYKLDVILPLSSATLLFNSSFYNSEQVSLVSDFMVRDLADEGTAEIQKINILPYITPYTTLLKAILSSLGALDVSTLYDFPKSIIETPTPNKNSLEYLWKSRTITKLKMWNGWKYKDVVITNVEVTKEPTEDGVEEATITCTEIPVMKMRTYNALKLLPKEKSSVNKAYDLAMKGIEKAGKALFEGDLSGEDTHTASLLR